MHDLADSLRLLAVPVLGWAAYRDLRTRRVPDRTWPPLVGLGVLALAFDCWAAWTGGSIHWLLVRVGLSIGVLVPLGVLFWLLGGFGGADAKAVATLAVVFPTVPVSALAFADVALPLGGHTLGVFSLTILTNAALLGAIYPVWLAGHNTLHGRFSVSMAVGLPIQWSAVSRSHGRLLARANGLDAGLDLDAIRMYLRWRDATLPALRADPDAARDPASLPAEPNPPGDGAITEHETTRPRTTPDESHRATEFPGAFEAIDALNGTETFDRRTTTTATTADDAWGASAFLNDADGAYGATPARLRAGLDALVTREEVWITPGVPFLVFLFLGLCVGLLYGDLLVAGMAWLGVF